MTAPDQLFLPTDAHVILPNGMINPQWWRYFQDISTGLSTIDLTSQVTGILPKLNGGTENATGAATTAATLATARTINGVSFNGSANITVTAAASTLSGATIAAGVTASSLTSVGTLSSLAVSGAITGMSDIYTTDWTDYSATSTIVGWSVFTLKKILYKAVGKTVFVAFNLAGTSNSVAVTFTLPYTSANSGTPFDGALGFAIDNSVTLTTAARYDLPANSATVSCFFDMSGAAWTNANTKRVVGQFWFETA